MNFHGKLLKNSKRSSPLLPLATAEEYHVMRESANSGKQQEDQDTRHTLCIVTAFALPRLVASRRTIVTVATASRQLVDVLPLVSREQRPPPRRAGGTQAKDAASGGRYVFFFVLFRARVNGTSNVGYVSSNFMAAREITI